MEQGKAYIDSSSNRVEGIQKFIVLWSPSLYLFEFFQKVFPIYILLNPEIQFLGINPTATRASTQQCRYKGVVL